LISGLRDVGIGLSLKSVREILQNSKEFSFISSSFTPMRISRKTVDCADGSGFQNIRLKRHVYSPVVVSK
jgi:hypothetical protein